VSQKVAKGAKNNKRGKSIKDNAACYLNKKGFAPLYGALKKE